MECLEIGESDIIRTFIIYWRGSNYCESKDWKIGKKNNKKTLL